MAREIQTGNTYQSRLLKLIPSEIIAAYIVICGIIPDEFQKWGLVVISSIFLMIIPFYLLRIMQVKKIIQIIITALSFIIWTYSLDGGALKAFGLYESWIASIILILWTLIVPIFVTSKQIK